MTELLSPPASSSEGDLGLDTEALVCTGIVEVTHDVRTLRLRRAGFRPFSFLAGQHLTVAVDVDGQRLERCYTMSSPPTRPDSIEITVKRVPGGPVSGWLHDRFRVGDRLHATGPLGRFGLQRHPAGRHLFLSAGSGITPLISMTRTMRDLGGRHDVAFVHSARTPADIVFRAELDSMASPDLRVTTVCETDAGDPGWRGERGRLTLPMLARVVPDLGEREVFVCGPAGYMASVRTILAEAGVDPARCHEESFVLGRAAGAPDSPAAPVGAVDRPATGAFAVRLRRSGRTVTCDADSFVLDAAARAGLSLPSSCGEGVCGTCRSTLLEGTVDMQHAGGIRPREVARQQILLCCSRPLEDLVIDA
jgi:ferredoxin-NADP reductase